MDWLWLLEFAMREAALFAAAGFLLLGAGDLLVDFIWLALRFRRRPEAAEPVAKNPGRLAIFVPAWDEAAVIGPMLRHARAALGAADYRLYVGCYPNDRATIAAARAAGWDKLRLVVGPAPGPTSKADNLNRLWEALLADEAAEGMRFKAVVLHDAEDVVHSDEARLFDAQTERFDFVQLPVVPLIDEKSHWVGAHYADEFAEAHGKELVVREALRASLPSAGVGCAVSRDALAALAAAHGVPFDPDSLTEDYELGLRLKAMGRTAHFLRHSPGKGRPIVATRGYFPGTLHAAVTQKGRWISGIALAGWDRLGWRGGLAERWMRLRDRQSVLAALMLCAGYLALLLWVLLLALGGPAQPFSPLFRLLVILNSFLLLWRLAMRFGFVARLYGWREGLRSLPRTVTGNIIAIMAARRALFRYVAMLRTGATQWDKTAHAFPRQLPAE